MAIISIGENSEKVLVRAFLGWRVEIAGSLVTGVPV
jgi:hypothetical protein